MNQQQHLQQLYGLQPAMRPYPPQFQAPPEEQESSSGSSTISILFWVFMLVGIMLASFYFLVLEPIVNRLKVVKPKEEPKKPAIIKLVEKESEEETLDDRFAKINDRYGLLDDSLMNKKNGHSFNDHSDEVEV